MEGSLGAPPSPTERKQGEQSPFAIERLEMRPRLLLIPIAAVLVATAPARSGEVAAQPAPESSAAPAAKDYDALFSDILQNLPERSRAKVDSARANAPAIAGEAAAVPENPPSPTGIEKREQALEKLSPEVKQRVEKAIQSMENRKKERAAEFKE